MAYTVKAGDSLGKIAKSLGLSSWQDLYSINKSVIGSNPDAIQVGMVLAVPGESDEAGTASSSTNSDAEAAAGGGSAPPNQDTVPTMSILSSPRLTWHVDRTTGKYYARYQLPYLDNQAAIMFEADKTQMEAIFGKGKLPPITSKIDSNRIFAEQKFQTVFGGNIAEVEGEGDFDQEVKRVWSLALDQESLPDWIANDPGAMSLLYVKTSENKSDDWFYENLERRNSFKNRFPGIEHFKTIGLSTREAVTAFTEFETKTKQLHAAAGFSPVAITPSVVGGIIKKGYSINQVQDSYQVWKRMNDHAPALAAFNQILQANGKAPLSGTEMYKFLAGEAPAEIYDIYEASAIQEAATASGFGDVFGGTDALGLALESSKNLDVDSAYSAFTEVANQALRFRHELNVEKFGIDIDDLIDISFGRAPRSGKTSADVGEVMARITNAAKADLNTRAGAYFSFDQEGRPKAASLGGLRSSS